jgi:hypothetical protein
MFDGISDIKGQLREYILSLNLLLNVKVKVEPEAITE